MLYRRDEKKLGRPENEYREVLQDTLKSYTQSAVDMIFKIETNLPEKAKSVEVGIHPNQDEDGMFLSWFIFVAQT